MENKNQHCRNINVIKNNYSKQMENKINTVGTVPKANK